MKHLYLLLFALSTFLCTGARAQTFDLELDVANAKRMDITEAPAGTYAITTTGSDPWVAVQPFMPGPYDPEQVYVISFDYLAADGLDFLEIFYGAVSPVRRATFTDLPATDGSYRTFKAFMKYEVANWDSPFQQLRFDFSKTAGAEITVRNLQLRAPAPTEVIELALNPDETNPNATTVTPDGSGGYTITSSGVDPWVASQPFTDAYAPSEVYVLTFDYQSEQELDDFRVFFGDPWTPARMSLFGPLPANPTTGRFTGFMQQGDIDWLAAAVSKLRFDFGRQPGKSITVSNFVLREPTNEERKQFTPPQEVETVDIELNVNLTSSGLTATKLADGSYRLATSGNDPWIRSETVTDIYDIDSTYILSLEYKTEQAYNVLELFYGPPINAGQLLAAGELPATTGWTTLTVNPRLIVDNFQDKAWTDFRFDFGKNEEETKEIFVRNIQLRKPTAQEVIDEQTSDKFVSRIINQDFVAYLNSTFASSVDAVKVDTTGVTVTGTVSGSGEYFLAEILPQEYGFNQDTFSTVLPLNVTDGAFTTRVDRFDPRADRDYDRLYSRWAVVTATGPDTYALASFTSWPTDIAYIARNNLPEDKAETIKGLDGLGERTISNFDDLVDLDIKSMKINLLLNGVYSLNPSALTHEFNGKSYNINQAFVERLDASIKRCTDSNIKTALVLLVPLNIGNEELRRRFVYPDAIDAGSSSPYSMANVATAEGVETYTAMIDFLSQRYSRPDKLYGRMDQWIIHNEVDAHTNWTYAGQKPYQLYTEIYDRSMRMVHYTIRKHNPTAKVFASFTKHWNSVAGSSANFKSRDILDVLTRLTTREGDYEWNIGWHSYPTNLFNPKVWEDSPAKTPLNLNAAEITPRNLEMIDAYVRQENVLYNGKKVRTILLSENGFSSNGERNPNANETTQAAALAYFWKKASGRLPSIENIQLHRWVDNPNEAGLEFGLWTVLPGTFDGFNEKKEGWYVWNAAGTNEEDAVLDPYKSTIGISDWSEIQYQVPTETTPHRVVMNIVNCDASLDDVLVSFNGEQKFPQSAGFVDFYNVASNVPQPYLITKGGTVLASDTLFVDNDLELVIDLQSVDSLAATTVSPTTIAVTYTGGAAGAEYVIERRTTDGAFTEVGRTTETAYADATVTPGQDYTYRVAIAFDASTLSCYSDEVDVTAPALVVDYRNGDLGKPGNQKITPILRLRNVSEQPVVLTGLTARYWFTTENTLPLKFHVDEEIPFAAGITGTFVAVTPALDGADYYLEIRFATDYVIPANGSTGDMRFKISANENNRFDETNDYSYADVASYVQTDRVTLYRDGTLVSGEEPGPITTSGGELPTTASVRTTAAAPSVAGLLYPNPASTFTDLQWSAPITSVKRLQLIDARGARVPLRTEIRADRLRLRFAGLPRGLYLLSAQVNGELITRRLLIGGR
ncbi:hypothetical protein LEM8419_02760 [Neolewinella maritima]|uniref:CBM3 domain-containing protein n=1 Tax=Neolewinella maritima TaxID=1383882 RepID=A0ABN8F770_9BACT|nr:DUF5722 domain-containing protein [Neolewinella maritima]CAH1001852.1 hypothetical protein LEM8419_02760 [Neolewinella maritima]